MAQAYRMKWDKRAGVAANARRQLPPMVTAYFSSVREFLADDALPRRLHRVRLASKRLRYTLELFRPCYPAGLEERLDALKKLQDWLGEVNDAVASGRLLRRALKRKPKVRKFLEDRAGEKAAQVGRYWKETFDAEGQEAWWTDFLAHHTRKPGAIQDVGTEQSRILRHSANRQREDTSNE
jgi:CHAD domain-containing protein